MKPLRIPVRCCISGLCACLAVFGHTGETLQPHDLWRTWALEPGVLAPVALIAILYSIGARRARGVSIRELACFWAGWFFLAASLISPLHPLGEALFSAHMAQHEILMLLAAPLLVLSRPLIPVLWSLPIGWRRSLGLLSKLTAVQRGWFWLTRPSIAWWIHAAALWVWHAPQLFQATLRNEWVHAAQHLSFFASALLFWWSLFYASNRASYGASFLYIFTTAVHTSILGALLTFSNRVWYPTYSDSTAAWGLTPLEDQQLGGLIMWIPANLVYLGAGLAVFALWLRESDVVAAEREYAR
jgi:putative membrane protein